MSEVHSITGLKRRCYICPRLKDRKYVITCHSCQLTITTDIKNTEQTSYSIRYVDSEFIPIEVFVGFVEIPSTSGIALYGQLQKTLFALNLDIARLRSQAYDGASNMRCKFRGLSSKVLTDFRKAIYSYCSGHCLNLILQDSLDSHFLKDATAVLKDVVNFVSKSPKGEEKFKEFCRLEEIDENPAGLRPLCSTRWVFRKPALDSFLGNYNALLNWFCDLNDNGGPDERAAGLSYTNKLTNFKTYFSICLLKKVCGLAHFTHVAIQGPEKSITFVRHKMKNLRAIFVGEGSAAASERFYHECVFAAGPIDEEGLGLEEPAAPRGWKRLERNATARHLRKGQVGIQ